MTKQKKMYYKTLKGLIKKTHFKQFSLNDFFSKHIYHTEKGHINISLSDDLEKEIKNLFLDFLGLPYFNCYKSCGIFDRLIINKRLRVEYIAGQNYPSEVRYIKKLLK